MRSTTITAVLGTISGSTNLNVGIAPPAALRQYRHLTWVDDASWSDYGYVEQFYFEVDGSETYGKIVKIQFDGVDIPYGDGNADKTNQPNRVHGRSTAFPEEHAQIFLRDNAARPYAITVVLENGAITIAAPPVVTAVRNNGRQMIIDGRNFSQAFGASGAEVAATLNRVPALSVNDDSGTYTIDSVSSSQISFTLPAGRPNNWVLSDNDRVWIDVVRSDYTATLPSWARGDSNRWGGIDVGGDFLIVLRAQMNDPKFKYDLSNCNDNIYSVKNLFFLLGVDNSNIDNTITIAGGTFDPVTSYVKADDVTLPRVTPSGNWGAETGWWYYHSTYSGLSNMAVGVPAGKPIPSKFELVLDASTSLVLQGPFPVVTSFQALTRTKIKLIGSDLNKWPVAPQVIYAPSFRTGLGPLSYSREIMAIESISTDGTEMILNLTSGGDAFWLYTPRVLDGSGGRATIEMLFTTDLPSVLGKLKVRAAFDPKSLEAYPPNQPTVTSSVTPYSPITTDRALPGDVITLNGANLDTTTKVEFDTGSTPAQATFEVMSPTQLHVTMPTLSSSSAVIVRTTQGDAAPYTFYKVLELPISTYFSAYNQNSQVDADGGLALNSRGYVFNQSVSFGAPSILVNTLQIDGALSTILKPTNTAYGECYGLGTVNNLGYQTFALAGPGPHFSEVKYQLKYGAYSAITNFPSITTIALISGAVNTGGPFQFRISGQNLDVFTNPIVHMSANVAVDSGYLSIVSRTPTEIVAGYSGAIPYGTLASVRRTLSIAQSFTVADVRPSWLGAPSTITLDWYYVGNAPPALP